MAGGVLTAKTKTRLSLFAGALFSVTLCFPAAAGFAQDNSYMSSRIDQLENQVQTLSRALYRGGKVPESMIAPAESSSAIASFEVRLSQIESQQRAMTGEIERLSHEVRQMQDRLERMAADNEVRFQQQEAAPSTTTNVVSNANETGAVLTGTPYMGSSGSLGTMSSSGAAETAESLYESGFSDIRAAKYDSAEAKFKQFLSLYSNHPLAANAQYWLGETYYVRGDYHQSAKMFAQGYQDFPQGAKAADSLLKLGLSLAKLGQKDDACLSFQQLKKEFPGEQNSASRRATQEMKQIGCK